MEHPNDDDHADPHHKNIMVMMRMTMMMVLKAERQVDADHSFVLLAT